MTDEAKIKFAELCGFKIATEGHRINDEEIRPCECLTYPDGRFYCWLSDYHPDRDLNQAVLGFDFGEYYMEIETTSDGIFHVSLYPWRENQETSAKNKNLAAAIVEVRMRIAEVKND